MQLIVVGFHRSGTSLLTQLLHTSGLFVGDDLLGAMPSNPYGHFEDREVLELHRQIMDDHGVSWHVDEPQLFGISPAQWREMEDFVQRRDAAHRNWGFKDPRVCFFLGAWKYLMPDAKFIMVYRDPTDCAWSLEQRHSTDYLKGSGDADAHLRFFREPDFGVKLWDAHNRAMVAFAKSHIDDCLVLPFTHLYSGEPIVSMINKKFGSDLVEVPTESVFDARATGSRPHPLTVYSDRVLDRMTDTWQQLEKLSTLTEVPR
ncbi:MAG TPA: sulfotransferase [Nocardioides sp.]|jgi:hypothetical protein